MKELHIDLQELEKILSLRVNIDLFSYLKKTKSKDLPKLVYTSFDGDDLSDSELMKQFILKSNRVPLNPESALGTYLVTNHYQGKKYEIIMDCLSLLSICDVFIVMTNFVPSSIEDYSKLPEGVLAELLYWNIKINPHVGFVNISNYRQVNNKNLHVRQFVNTLHPLKKQGINKILKTKISVLRKVVYLLSGEKHAKHTDWMRKDAYDNNRVPLCPYSLLNKSTLDIAYGKNRLAKILSRISIAIRTEELWLYGTMEENQLNLEELETDLLIELYLVCKIKMDPIKVLYKYFGAINVPKYSNRSKWAITEYEKTYQT